MRLTVWGARGSIPVSGAQYDRYGGDTTCVEVEADDGTILILDAGTGMRRLGNRYITERPECREFHLLLTHAHWDHLMGFGFFKPIYHKGYTLNLHGCLYARQSIRAILARAMSPPFFPVDLSEIPATICSEDTACPEEFRIGPFRCRSLPISHPNNGYGFRVWEGNRSFAFFPDNELSFAHPGARSYDDTVNFVRGAELLIHDAEYLPSEYEKFSKGFGHSRYTDTVRLAADAGVGSLMLWHLNQDRDDAGVDALVADSRSLLKARGSAMPCRAGQTGYCVEF